jgi:hypothetical protein
MVTRLAIKSMSENSTIDDKAINERAAVGGMKTGKGKP